MSGQAPSLRVGIVCEPLSGHLNPAMTIGRALKSKGHEVHVFGLVDVEATVRASGLDFVPIGVDEFPSGVTSERWLEHPRGARALVHSVRLHTEETEVLCRDVPSMGAALGLDMLLVDQLQVCGPHLAEALQVPMVTLCAGPGMLRLDDGSFPPPFLDRAPSTALTHRVANRGGFAAMAVPAAPRLRVTNRWARRRGLRPVRKLEAASSDRLQISALVAEMNFGVAPPPGDPMRLVGPIVDDARSTIDFPWDRLDERPLVYASLGTVQRGAHDLRSMIVEACRGLGLQLVISHGGTDEPSRARPTRDVIEVAYAPQLDLLQRASLCITHCGMNTTMECAANAVPMVGLPILYDQPAVAARIRSAGVGLSVSARKGSVGRLAEMVDEVMNEPRYRERAKAVAEACAAAPGVPGAVTMIEQVALRGES